MHGRLRSFYAMGVFCATGFCRFSGFLCVLQEHCPLLSGLEMTLGCGFLICGRAVVLSPGLLLMVLECALREVARGSRIAGLLRSFFYRAPCTPSFCARPCARRRDIFLLSPVARCVFITVR